LCPRNSGNGEPEHCSSLLDPTEELLEAGLTVRDVELLQDRACGVGDPNPVCVATDVNADAKLRLHACLLAA
jgi:hypothetical protein